MRVGEQNTEEPSPCVYVWIAMKIGRIKNEEESCGKINLDPDSSRIERFIYGYTD
jgi:hypothetical protein